MNYDITVADADADLARTPGVGADTRMKYSVKSLMRKVGSVKMDAVDSGVFTKSGGFSAVSAGVNMQAILQTANPGVTKALMLIFAATLGNAAAGTVVALYSMPSYALDQGFHMPQSLGADVRSVATGTVTSNNTNVSDGNVVTIGTTTYTFKTALTPTTGEVLIGTSADASLLNLINAINATGVNGTDYQIDAAHPTVVADAAVSSTHVFKLYAVGAPGTAGNAIALTKTATTLTVSGSTLLGGYSTIRSLNSLTSIQGGAPGVELGLFVLPDTADWVDVQESVKKNLDPGGVGSVGIAQGYNATKHVVKGRGGAASVSISSKHASFAQDVARLHGQRCVIMTESWGDDRVLRERMIVETILAVNVPHDDGNSETEAMATGMGVHVGIFV